jgi:hypothetical protein
MMTEGIQRSLQQLVVVVDEDEGISRCGIWQIYIHEIWRVPAFLKDNAFVL